MKNLKNFMLLVMVGSLLTITTSCSSDDDGGGGTPTAAAGTMAATVNGSGFQSEALTSNATKITAGGITTLTLRGGDFSGNTIVMIINGYEGPDNTYEFDSESISLSNASYTEVDISNINNPTTTSWVAPYMDSGVAGSVTIATDDEENVTGTFNVTLRVQDGTETIEISGGSFNLEFTDF